MLIGNVEIKNKVVVAPMAGITNTSYRKICKDMGAGLIVGEMVSDKAICYDNEKTFDLLKVSDYERPFSQQIFGGDPESMKVAVKKILETSKPDILDINMGCPVPKVALRASAGSSLLKDPDRVREIVKAVVSVSTVPVTVKIRSGWDLTSINAPLIAKICEEEGASAIAVHARTRSQGYSGEADWNIIKEVKDTVNIPVIGNGDVTSCYDAERMLKETGCDLVMIGRGILGNPWLLNECVTYLETGIVIPKPSNAEKLEMMNKHIDLLFMDKADREAGLLIRNSLMYYLKGMPNTHTIKQKIVKCITSEEYKNVLKEYENSI